MPPLRTFGIRSTPSFLYRPRVLPYPVRSTSYTRIRSATMADLAAERFLADRSAPVCSLNVSKSFGQLT